jgi:hypothetical protein
MIGAEGHGIPAAIDKGAIGRSKAGCGFNRPVFQPRTIFITVGTTQFNALVSAASSPAFLSAARALGYARVLIQHGRGPIGHEHLHRVPFFMVSASDQLWHFAVWR